MIARTEESFREEIAVLAAACEQHERELHQLQNLFKEQARLSQDLEIVDDYLEEERNRLQIEAHAFGHIQHQLSRTLRDTQREIDALSAVRLHATLFHLVVDKRGIRYPLINDLRLAYRPKGDVQWTEISAAWSQAAQLLLLVAASAKFRSKDWRIVPLTSCAKLIHLDGKHRAVYTLGGSDNPESQHGVKMFMSLRAMNALFDQLCRHMSTLQQAGAPPLPYETSRNRIARFELSQLDDGNDSGWSSVIHCMASNLQWLSDRASDYEIQNVTVAI
jgi:beclin 1